MPTDQPPIPHEALPPGWGPAEVRDEHVAYRHRQPQIELVAERTEANQSHPALGLCRCWELRYRHPIGELSITKSIGHVSTRRAAFEGLLESMNRIHEFVDDLHDPLEVRAALESVSLDSVVPDGAARPQ